MNQNFITPGKCINRVIFAGDPVRGDQAGNIEKTHKIFAPLLRQFGMSVSKFITDINKNTNRDEWIPVWREYLSNYSDSKFSFIDASETAVIGFEIPQSELDYLSARGVRWINLCIHPLRFLDDLHFDLSTSFSFDKSTISAPLGYIDSCADQIIQRYANGANQDDRRTLLICDQVWFDRSVYFDGKFRELNDYTAELDSIVAQHDRVIYKPHPAFLFTEASKFFSLRFNAEVCKTTNIYELFASNQINTITAISSSVLTEAPFFGIDAVFLEPRAKRYGLPVSYRELVDSVDFWGGAFLRTEEKIRSLKISASVPANYIRKNFGSWSFITEEMDLERRLGVMEMKVQHAEAKVEQAYEQQLQRQLQSAQQTEHGLTQGLLAQQQLVSTQNQLSQALLVAQASQDHAQQLQSQLAQQTEQAQSQGLLAQQQHESSQNQLTQALLVAQASQEHAQQLQLQLAQQTEQAQSQWLLAQQQLECSQNQLTQALLVAQTSQAHAQQLQLQVAKLAEQAQTQGLLAQQQLESSQNQLGQAQSVSEGLLKENQKLKASLSVAEEELHQVHQANHHHWLLATRLQQHNTSLLQSWSWRLTEPVRATLNLTRHPIQTTKQMANKAFAWGLNTFSKPLGHGMAWVLARPQLAERINRQLLGWPHLHDHMLTIARKQGVVKSPAIHTLKNREEHKTELYVHTASQHLVKLSPRAQQIYNDLQSAIKRHQAGNN